VSVKNLTLEEVKDILMGGDLTPCSNLSRRLSEILLKRNSICQDMAVNVRTHDKHGREILSSNTSPYERQRSFSQSD
jgi:hypothetical protein